MKLKPFNVHEDMIHINTWLTKHNMPTVTRLALPEIGYIAWEHSKPIGAAFLRRCEGGLGIVDSLISNPDSSSELRHIALDALINRIVEISPKHKVTMLLGYTKDSSTLLRSTRLGFAQSPFAVVVKTIPQLENR